MAISKVVLNGTTQMDVTTDTVDAQYMVSGKTATKADGTKATGMIASKSSSDLTASGATVTVPAGYYSAQASKSVATATQATPSVSVNTSTGLITATATQTAGYVSAGSKSGTSQLSVQAGKTVTPTESEQTAVAAQRYTTGAVKVAAVSPTYVGSGVTRRDGDDITEDDGIFTIPSGYYEDDATAWLPSAVIGYDSYSVNSSTGRVQANLRTTTPGYATGMYSGQFDLPTQAAKTVTPSTSSQTAVAAGKYTTGAVTVAAMPSGTAGTPTATKGSVSNHSVSVTPSVTNSTGYITGSTKTGTAVTVTASELVSGTKSITENGTGIDVTNYASVDVSVSAVATHTATIGQGSTGQTFVQYNNVVYRNTNSTFEFSTGDTCELRAYSDMGDGSVYVDDVKVATTTRTEGYTYTLPDGDIIIELSNNVPAYVKVYTSGSIDFHIWSLIDKTISGSLHSTITTVPSCAFQQCQLITAADFPNVTRVNYSAFQSCSSLSIVSMPKVTYIDSYAFQNCSRLTELNFPSLSSIGSFAFSLCRSLASFTAPSLRSMGTNAFAYCYSLQQVSFPLLSSVPNQAFLGCSALSMAYLPSVLWIGASAFYGTALNSIECPNVTSIASNAFYGCQLSQVTFSKLSVVASSCFVYNRSLTVAAMSSVTIISSNAFYLCEELQIASFTSVTNLFGSAFANCSKLHTVNMPKLINIGSSAFYGCSMFLSSVSFPSIAYIESGAFYNCQHLSSVFLYRSVGSIYLGASAFQRCFSLTALYFLPATFGSLPYSNAFDSTPIAGYTESTGGAYGSIYVPASLYASFVSATNWVLFSSRFVSLTSEEITALLG